MTGDTPKVSVIMNCYNCSKYLTEAIESVYAQTYKNWEIIFWDNASTDSSADIANSYDKRLRYFRGENTVPLYAARNLALQQAKGAYITFLDCDDIWFPDKLRLQVKAFEEKPSAGLVHTNVEILEYTGSTRIYHRRIQKSGRVLRDLLKKYNINLQTVMISRKVLNGLDYCFDQSMNHSGDADLFLRIAHDWDVIYIQEVTAQYREHEGSGTATRIEALLSENEKILKYFLDRYRDFTYKYKDEIRVFRNKTRLSVVIAKWKYSGGTEARKYIVAFMPKSIVFLVLYPLSFFPYRFISFIWYQFLKR